MMYALVTSLWAVNSDVVAWYKRQPLRVMKTLHTLEFSLEYKFGNIANKVLLCREE